MSAVEKLLEEYETLMKERAKLWGLRSDMTRKLAAKGLMPLDSWIHWPSFPYIRPMTPESWLVNEGHKNTEEFSSFEDALRFCCNGMRQQLTGLLAEVARMESLV